MIEENTRIHRPEEKTPDNNLEKIASVDKSDIENAILSWEKNPPDEEFSSILKSEETNNE